MGTMTIRWACLFLLLLLGRTAARLAKQGATHPSFPTDAYANPAYRVIFRTEEPVGNRTALQWLRHGHGKEDNDGDLVEAVGLSPYGQSEKQDDSREAEAKGSGEGFRAYLHRSSTETLHVCTLAKQKRDVPQQTDLLDESSMEHYRTAVLQRALKLLEPLKDRCIYYRHDWFTYGLCYGDAIRQFHAVSGTGVNGKAPVVDANQDSFVLGRWHDNIEQVRRSATEQPVGREARAATIGDGHTDALPYGIEQGTELMELVHFSSIEPEAGSQHEVAKTSRVSSVEGKGRYISQVWSDGTLCNINNESRTTEVQFHCAKTPPVDRISSIKEVTTCNYVVVVETPRLCSEPALAQAEDPVEEIHCHPIVSDADLKRRLEQNVRDAHASLTEGAAQGEKESTSNDPVAEARKHASVHALPGIGDASEADEGGQTDPEAEKRAKLAARLRAIIEKQTQAARARQASTAEGVQLDEVQIVVGMDETGELVLEPHREGFGSLADRFLRATKAHKEGEAGEEGDEMEERAPHFDAVASHKWSDVIQTLVELQGTVDLADGQTFEVIQGTPLDANGVPQHHEEEASERTLDRDQGSAAPAGESGEHGPTTGSPGTDGARIQAPRQRGNMMVRETETFAQRVDRIYRAQDEREKKANEKISTGQGDRSADVHHDEL